MPEQVIHRSEDAVTASDPVTAATARPKRILHVVAGMNRAGLETWLMNVMRHLDRDRFRFDFCTGTEAPCDYDEEIRSLGGRIVPCPWDGNPLRFRKQLREILRRGRYDVVHAHFYNFAGLVLAVAAGEGVRVRVAHLHSTGDGRRTTPVRIAYRRLMKHLIRRHATLIIGCARGALASYFGPDWHSDPRMHVVYYGIDLRPFEEPVDRINVRTGLGVPPQAPMVLHIGRFIPAKNHHMLLEVFAALRRERPEARLVLVGDGPLLPQVQVATDRLQLRGAVHFAGVRSDVADLMKSADLTIMPSIREGLPLTLVEATAAGIPAAISDLPGVREAVDAGLEATLVPVDAPLSVWVRTALDRLESRRSPAVNALERVRRSPFASETSARALQRLYTESA